jgi:flagellar hook protein FlgE
VPPSATTTLAESFNLDAQATIPTVTPFSPTNQNSFTYQSTATIYDSLGESHALNTYFVKTGPTAAAPAGTEATWSVYATLDGTQVGPGGTTGAAAPPLETLQFTTTGALDTVASPQNPPLAVTLPVTDGSTSPLAFTLDFTGTTQYGAPNSANAPPIQNGYSSGELSSFSASANGTIVGTYTNGQSATLGQIVLADFTDPNGLQSLGNNQWAATAASGQPLVGVPGTGQLGVLQSNATEDSNVDLTSQLVNMITAQEDYQANAQTVKTEDTLVQTLITLR